MACSHAYALTPGGEACFSVDLARLVFGRGALGELGEHAWALGCRRVALFTDPRLARLEPVERAVRSLAAAGVEAEIFAEVRVEPTDRSLREAARFAAGGRFDGYVSVGGGSVIDTCKVAQLLATHPAELLRYVNRPVGEGAPVPGPLPPHLACPTTSGTGSECTGIAVFDLRGLGAKTAIASPALRPSLAIIDPDATRTLPAGVVAASGHDVLCHALESYTARPFTRRPRPEPARARPMSQGANPWSDLGSLEAARLAGRFLARAVRDAADDEAREQMSLAATLAGIAFGNAGVHLPHAMAYGVAGQAHAFRMPGYPQEEPFVPHGVSVVLSAPAVFRATGPSNPARHLALAEALGADPRGAGPDDAGRVLAEAVERLMRATGIPAGLAAVGLGPADVPALTAGTLAQTRLLDNAPIAAGEGEIAALFGGAMAYG